AGGAVTVGGEAGGDWGRARRWSEELDVADAKVVARYADGPFAGRAAVTRVGRGAGQAWYVSCDLEDAGLWKVLSRAGLSRGTATPPAGGVGHRGSRDAPREFVLNHGSGPVRGADLGMAVESREVLSGVSGAALVVPAGGVAVLRGPRRP